jgi:hypothetical protein
VSQRAVLAARQGSQDCIKHTVKVLRNCFSKELQHNPGSTLVSSAANLRDLWKAVCGDQRRRHRRRMKTKGVALERRTVPKSAPNRSSEFEKHRWRNIKSFAQFLDVGFVEVTLLMQDFGYDAFRAKDWNHIFLTQIIRIHQTGLVLPKR